MRMFGVAILLGALLTGAPIASLQSSAAAAFNGPFYVSPTGRNTNAGTKIRPWKTIQHAADRLRAGLRQSDAATRQRVRHRCIRVLS